MQKLSFAIIGGGPAAFYLSKCLAKLPEQPAIHIFEKEYCPFGLIRYGVAPDHISIKKAETTLSSVGSYPHFQYHGNQGVDAAVLSELRQQYSGVVYALGAQENNQPQWLRSWQQQHPSSRQVLHAREVVYWYNNHPAYETYRLDLQDKRDVVVIGNGNVAIDIARVLLKSPSELAHTEISSNALESLGKSGVRNVTLVGRRGFTHSAFALKEIRELSTARIGIYCLEEELMGSMNESSYIECTSISVVPALCRATWEQWSG